MDDPGAKRPSKRGGKRRKKGAAADKENAAPDGMADGAQMLDKPPPAAASSMGVRCRGSPTTSNAVVILPWHALSLPLMRSRHTPLPLPIWAAPVCVCLRAGVHPQEEESVPEGEVVLTVENKSPLHDVFQFQRINGGLTR